MIQTMDYRPLPGGYGHGSGTLAGWIRGKMEDDKAKGQLHFPPTWGSPPAAQTRDLVDLPHGYGKGSGTLRDWINSKAGPGH